MALPFGRRLCVYCKKNFDAHYISRHQEECRKVNKKPSETKLDLSFLDESEDDNDSNDGVLYDDNYILSDDEAQGNEDVGEELLNDVDLEALLEDFAIEIDEHHLPVRENTKNFLFLVTWLCLFLALWQYTFSITDSALEHLLKFIKVFFDFLGQKLGGIREVAAIFPSSLYLFQKHFSKESTLEAKKYVVCTKCFALYEFDACVRSVRGVAESKHCTKVLYPNHPQKHRRKQCGQILMMKYRTASGKMILYPLKTYCYLPIKKSLELLLSKPGFMEKCELWRKRTNFDNVLSDIYDGRIWKEFIENGFFTLPNNYGLMLNLDWFCPYKHVKNISVGAIYAVITNLPRSERFKRENLILIGLIPSMKAEPKTNTFLEPLVSELQTAWNTGFVYNIATLPVNPIVVRLALIMVGCDIPACRKLCGFLGHSAVLGCSRCKKQFPGPIGGRNYGGFDTENWTKRTNATHRAEMEELKRCKTKTEQETMESKLGTRYSVLIELPYYDSIRMAIIDPMHNLFSGSAKRLIKIWKEKGYLTKNTLHQIQEIVDKAEVPADIGKLPGIIDNFSFDGFTADEYKNFFLLFSIYSLHDILPRNDLECLRKFVIACTYLCNRVLTVDDVRICESYLKQFCISYERLYGEESVTPNMHLHCHLVECIYDFGPIYSFWLFSFERYNGLLGKIPTNKRGIEIQFMRRFCRESLILSKEMPTEERETFEPVLKSTCSAIVDRGSLIETFNSNYTSFLKLPSRLTDYSVVNWELEEDNLIVRFSGKKIQSTLSHLHHEYLARCYKSLYPQLADTDILLPPSFWKSHVMYFQNEIFGSVGSRSNRSSFVTAYWCGKDGSIQSYEDMYLTPRPGRILYFVSHILYLNGQPKPHIFAFIEWFLPMSDLRRYQYGKPVEVWSSNLFEMLGAGSFIPIQRLKSKFFHLKTNMDGRDVMVIVPRNRAMNI